MLFRSYVNFKTFKGRPSFVDLFRVFLFAKEPIDSNCFFQSRPVVSPIPQSFEIERNDFHPPSRDNASKNRHLLVVVASLLARGSGDGVWKRWPRRWGAIMELKWFVYILRFYDFGVLARARRITTPTVATPKTSTLLYPL